MKYLITCTQCGTNKIFEARTTRAICDKARDEGWAISTKKGSNNKWCPNCAPLHRHVGRRGGARSFVQIKLDV